MTERGRPPTDEIRTEIYDSMAARTKVTRPEDDETTEKTEAPERAARVTAPGYGRAGGTSRPLHRADSEPASIPMAKRSEPMRAATPPEGAPIKVFSLKTPAEIAAARRPDKKSRRIPKPHIRSIGEVSGTHTPPGGMGFLAPPRDPAAARTRHARSNTRWAAVALGIAVVVGVAIWLLSSRL